MLGVICMLTGLGSLFPWAFIGFETDNHRAVDKSMATKGVRPGFLVRKGNSYIVSSKQPAYGLDFPRFVALGQF